MIVFKLVFMKLPKTPIILSHWCRNEFGGVFGSWFWAETPVEQCLELHTNSAGPVSNHSIFHYHETHTIYTKSKIVKRWLRIWGPYLTNHCRFVGKWLESHRLTVEARPKKLRFTRSDGFGWKGHEVLSSKMAKMTWKLARGGWKMAKNAAFLWS